MTTACPEGQNINIDSPPQTLANGTALLGHSSKPLGLTASRCLWVLYWTAYCATQEFQPHKGQRLLPHPSIVARIAFNRRYETAVKTGAGQRDTTLHLR